MIAGRISTCANEHAGNGADVHRCVTTWDVMGIQDRQTRCWQNVVKNLPF